MAKSKAELLTDAQKAGAAPETATEDDYTAAELTELLSGERVVDDYKMADKPIVAPDGHVVLSQEDIDARS